MTTKPPTSRQGYFPTLRVPPSSSTCSKLRSTRSPRWRWRRLERGLRGLRARHVRIGVPQEPGRPASLRVPTGSGSPEQKIPGPAAPALRSGGRDETSSAGAVPPTEGNEGRREGRRASEHPVVPQKLGNPTGGTRWREGDAGARNRWRATCRVLRNSSACQQNNNG